jgi:hypothetical protein
VRAAPRDQGDRLEEARLARGIRPPDQLRSRPEFDFERVIATKVLQT